MIKSRCLKLSQRISRILILLVKQTQWLTSISCFMVHTSSKSMHIISSWTLSKTEFERQKLHSSTQFYYTLFVRPCTNTRHSLPLMQENISLSPSYKQLPQRSKSSPVCQSAAQIQPLPWQRSSKQLTLLKPPFQDPRPGSREQYHQ